MFVPSSATSPLACTSSSMLARFSVLFRAPAHLATSLRPFALCMLASQESLPALPANTCSPPDGSAFSACAAHASWAYAGAVARSATSTFSATCKETLGILWELPADMSLLSDFSGCGGYPLSVWRCQKVAAVCLKVPTSCLVVPTAYWSYPQCVWKYTQSFWEYPGHTCRDPHYV